MDGMNELLRQKSSDNEKGFENPFGGKKRGKKPAHMGQRRDKGFFRIPRHAEQERSNKHEEDDDQWRRNHFDEDEEGKKLQHLKLVFPYFTEGDDAKSWVQDCEEYFSIYGIHSQRRIAIARMHLHGFLKYWYKSYINDKKRPIWRVLQMISL